MSLWGAATDVLKSAARGALGGLFNSYVGSGPGGGTQGTVWGSSSRGGFAGGLNTSGLVQSFLGPLDPTQEGSLGDMLVPDALVGTECTPRTLRSGRVRYPRHRADGSCYFPRRMNPLNPRAARRAIRRIKGVRRITRDIERSLPKVSVRRRSA
jgi:hypothetical protein